MGRRAKQDVFANGRKAALQCLDVMLSEDNNIQLLRKDLQNQFNLSPSSFFMDFVMPLLPKETIMSLEGDKDKAPVRIIMETGDAEGITTTTTTKATTKDT
jgi:hypothetical protein